MREQGLARAEAAEARLAATRKPGAEAPLPLSAYAGHYADDFDGAAHVTVEDGHLVLRLGNPDFTGDLEHWHDNTFRVTWRYRFYGTAYVTFDVNALGQPERLSIAQTPLHYERLTEPPAGAGR
jgi:hypothetical protein